MALSLGLEFLLHLLNPGLDLLDGLLNLGHQGLLVLQLAQEARGVLLLALDGVLRLLLGPLQLGHGLLHDLQLALDLAPLLLNVGTAALLLLVRALRLIKGGLQLILDLVEMANLVLSHLKVLLGLSSILADVLLLLVELVDDLILVGDLIIQALDGVVTVGLLLLQLLDGDIDVVNVLLDGHNLLLQDLLVLHGVLASLLPLGELVLGGHKLVLVVSNLGGGLGLLLVVHGQVTLLLLQLGHQSLLLLLDGLILLQEPGLGVQLVLVHTIGGIGLLLKKPEFFLGVGHADERTSPLDDDEPSPLSQGHVLPEVPLGNIDQLPLVPLLGVDHSTVSLENLSLDLADPFDDEVIASLLKSGKSTSSEEDEGVSQPVSVPGEADLVHKSVGGGLVVAGAGNLGLSQASISHLEVRVKHSVGETSHTDPDTLKHTITGQLMHNQRRLNLSGLLVGVGHKATDKVGLARVEGGHQLSQRDEVDRGHSLATASLLLLLTLILGGSSGLSRVVGPEKDKKLAGAGGLEDLDNSVVDRILVLLQPASNVVGHNTSVVRDGKVSILVSLGLGLQEHRQLAKGSLQLLLKGLVSGFGEERLLL